jgi:DNA replication and repair protein RecF
LAVKLAVASFLRGLTGESPIVLLDDVFSELDARRREAVLRETADFDQLFVTTTDEGFALSSSTRTMSLFRVSQGEVNPL